MADDDAFFSRWSRRKALARHGQPPAEPPAPARAPAPPVAPPVARTVAPPVALPHANDAGAGMPATPRAPSTGAAPRVAAAATPTEADTPAQPPPPTLDDVARLAPDASDFSRFVARGVQPEVKNAALKKLFSDPHFNLMDGLDIYIDDYGKPDPLPVAMLRQMVQGRFLGLFDDDGAEQPPGPDTARHGTPAPHTPPEPAAPALPAATATAGAHPPPTAAPRQEPLPHENADLRLQPHAAAGPPGPAPGAGPSGRPQQC